MVQGCLTNNREAQRKLYQHFYGYAMSICVRYSKDAEEAREVLNDGFMKVFTKLKHYDQKKPFKAWLRRVMINTALDNYRHNLKHYHTADLELAPPVADASDVVSELNYAYLMELIQQLSPAYRTVFNLYVIDGYTHEEIAEILGISSGTSKSNLSKARANLREVLKKNRVNELEQYI
ncbi:RNA polymerase sigma factor [Rufibacter sediminis]|uniref:Sigma-70 family RNA polymerase sigma factor n=1 Tax=Rufibacter sediminis TaxID=2762756 RepID=A0ABR6VVW1_9BACT|nr:sigma-70 family RNA polymerase sigma factor [Rufibacter sediminis]MBC3541044.1 sigma-70 family RNA polymerase sigma factor [Rufibacter sediminis]